MGHRSEPRFPDFSYPFFGRNIPLRCPPIECLTTENSDSPISNSSVIFCFDDDLKKYREMLNPISR